MKCRINNCNNKVKYVGKRLCRKHYIRFWRYKTFELTKHGKGGLNCQGYKRITINSKRIFEHRYIMEQYLGRKLLNFPKETIHHINGIKTDNRIENLIVISQGEHVKNIHKDIWKYRKQKPIIYCNICGKKQKAKQMCNKHYYQWYYQKNKHNTS